MRRDNFPSPHNLGRALWSGWREQTGAFEVTIVCVCVCVCVGVGVGVGVCFGGCGINSVHLTTLGETQLKVMP